MGGVRGWVCSLSLGPLLLLLGPGSSLGEGEGECGVEDGGEGRGGGQGE